jgi:hypothetical protein
MYERIRSADRPWEHTTIAYDFICIIKLTYIVIVRKDAVVERLAGEASANLILISLYEARLWKALLHSYKHTR